MRYAHALLLVLLLELAGFGSRAFAGGNEFPVPPSSPTRLFYIQRSNNANTVIYEANMLAGRRLDPNEPVNVYWIRYAERGQREKLSLFQWKMAYGYKHQALDCKADCFEIQLNAFKKRLIWVDLQHGKPVALTTINGRKACLQKVFVQLESESGLIPKVRYVELFGVDPVTGTPIYERMMV
ncbi:DUF4833 domain-containing protein [Larkinella sp. VNQ87]|uniref:DUF4833 domain-containing protein n=1 Tax=Larkinella sp. VNQ87 TaxID=3400921 RepID=UPI003C080708